MLKTCSRLIKAAVFAVLAVTALTTQSLAQTTYPKPITGTTITITSGGKQRTFIVHTPTTPKSSPGAVLIFHGGSGSTAAASMMQALTLMDNQADVEGFYSVYPQALGGNWNDGRISTAGGPDDVQFIRDVVTYLNKTYKVSTAKVFSAGISNGGIMQYQLACAAPGLMRAVAPVAADITDLMRSACTTTKLTPVMMFSGTGDNFMPYTGGYPFVNSGAKFVAAPAKVPTTAPQTDAFTSAPDTAAFFASKNGCKSSTTVNMPDTVNDGTTVTKQDYAGCAAGGGMTFFAIINGGHTWPGTTRTGDPAFGLNTRDIIASTEMVNFFKKFGL
jgi:polyhydroxybutyrate depolymerase